MKRRPSASGDPQASAQSGRPPVDNPDATPGQGGPFDDPQDAEFDRAEHLEPDFWGWPELDDGLETEPEPGDFDIEPEWDDQ
jgi:hypothetical protein